MSTWIILQLVHRQHSLLVQPGPDALVKISVVILHIEELEFEAVDQIVSCDHHSSLLDQT